MFRFICKTLLEQRRSVDLNVNCVRYLQTLTSLNSISRSPPDERSLTVSYLKNSCGLSLEEAISASNVVNIKNTQKPNSVIQLLKSHGFTNSQIASFISKYPRILLAEPEKNLKPKIEYFKSVGILGLDLPKFLCSNKQILLCSLKNQIIPTFDFLKGFVQTNENLLFALKNSSRVISCNIEKLMVPNIKTLRAHGVPEPLIARLIMLQPQSLILRADLFDNVVDVVKEMGFQPTSGSFILAIRSMSVMSKATWESKKEILISFGWSEDEFVLAFKRQPILMLSSAKKIRKLMDFYVNEVGLKPQDIIRYPHLLLVSMEQRIFPRWSVLKVLKSKNLLEKDINVVRALIVCKKEFEKKFVTRYVDGCPDVIKAYQSRVDVQDVVRDCET
ncbi:Transcription termination factor like [Melia azedarach]|uniref:Transcription termination factor like n=2 Tax=Melia azedarach TaxID=155640 RepID=A0ACC1Z065_MELAZ|nr:Transcription termination factor like [Melia azedarach]KAJ4729431.1 Transcription termination factor like [Melia azedarach]